LFGNPCNIEAIEIIAKKYGLSGGILAQKDIDSIEILKNYYAN